MTGRMAVGLFVALVALAAPRALPAGEPELRVTLPQDPPRVGQAFRVVAEVRWSGAPDLWIVRSLDGPSLTGVRDLGHVVAGGVGQGSEGPTTWQRHELTLVGDGEGPATVGPVAVDLVGEGGVTRHLASRSLGLTVLPGPRTPLVVAGAVAGLAVVLVLWLVIRRARRPAMVAAEPSPDEALRASLAELETLAGGDDVRALYGRALDLTVELLAAAGVPPAERSEDAVAASVAALDGLPSSLAHGVRRLAEDSKLVRFAGLRPEATERSAVVSRVRELAAFVGRSHSGA